MCLFPAVNDGREVVLTTCTNGRDTTWEIALVRGYTLMPKPYIGRGPELLRRPSLAEIAGRAWRSRARHKGLLAAFGAERAAAVEETRRENERRQADGERARRRWQEQRDRAARTFRERHR